MLCTVLHAHSSHRHRMMARFSFVSESPLHHLQGFDRGPHVTCDLLGRGPSGCKMYWYFHRLGFYVHLRPSIFRGLSNGFGLLWLPFKSQPERGTLKQDTPWSVTSTDLVDSSIPPPKVCPSARRWSPQMVRMVPRAL